MFLYTLSISTLLLNAVRLAVYLIYTALAVGVKIFCWVVWAWMCWLWFQVY